MVPRTRLIIWTALVVLPLATLAGTVSLVPSVVGIALFLFVVLGDAVAGSGRLRPIQLRLPELVRLQKDRTGDFEITARNEGGRARTLRVALAFPETVEAEESERFVVLPAGVVESRLAWSCRPTKRGQFTLHDIFVETRSPLGFWAFRARQRTTAELRVYPDLREERRRVAALFLRRGRAGVHTQRSAGTGREFEKLRDFSPGDSLADVNWKASARRHSLVSKVYQVERTHEVYVLVDCSRLSARPVEGGLAMERYVSAALILALAAEQQGDQFGLVTFSDRVHSFVRARSGPAHLDLCRDQLYGLQPREVAPDFEELFTLLRLRLRKRALLIVLTALDDPVLAASFVKATNLCARQHLLLVDMLRPPGVEPLFSTPADSLDDVYRALGGHFQWQKLRELQLTLRRRGVRLSFLRAGDLAAEMLAQHAEARARQLA